MITIELQHSNKINHRGKFSLSINTAKWKSFQLVSGKRCVHERQAVELQEKEPVASHMTVYCLKKRKTKVYFDKPV